MKNRVTNANCPYWDDYGGRGITLNPAWLDFEKFLADMGEKPPGATIDRINNSKGYEPGNCRWAHRDIQSRNTRRNRWVVLDGRQMVVKDAAKILGLSDTAVYQRMKRKNIEPQEAIDQLAAVWR